MMSHELKTWPEPFEAIRKGDKRFELRRFDRDFQVGDVLRLREWDPSWPRYTGRVIRARITYILRSGFGLPEGLCVMSLAEVEMLHFLAPPAESETPPRSEEP